MINVNKSRYPVYFSSFVEFLIALHNFHWCIYTYYELFIMDSKIKIVQLFSRFLLCFLERIIPILESIPNSNTCPNYRKKDEKLASWNRGLERFLFTRISIEHLSAMALYYVLRAQYTLRWLNDTGLLVIYVLYGVRWSEWSN